MSTSSALAKLAKSAQLSAEAAELFREAVEELELAGRPDVPDNLQPTDLDVARARKVLARLGSRT